MPSTLTAHDAMSLAQANANLTGEDWCVFQYNGRYYVETLAPSHNAVAWFSPVIPRNPEGDK